MIAAFVDDKLSFHFVIGSRGSITLDAISTAVCGGG